MHPKKKFALLYCTVVAVVLFMGGRGACSYLPINFEWRSAPTAADKYQMELEIRRRYMERAEREGKPFEDYHEQMYREIMEVRRL